MKGYEQYVKDVLEGRILVCKYVRQVVERFEEIEGHQGLTTKRK